MFQDHIKDTKKYRLNLDTADETLQNIFEACDRTPNVIPLETLASQKDLLVRPLTKMTYACHIVLFLILLVPFWLYSLS